MFLSNFMLILFVGFFNSAAPFSAFLHPFSLNRNNTNLNVKKIPERTNLSKGGISTLFEASRVLRLLLYILSATQIYYKTLSALENTKLLSRKECINPAHNRSISTLNRCIALFHLY